MILLVEIVDDLILLLSLSKSMLFRVCDFICKSGGFFFRDSYFLRVLNREGFLRESECFVVLIRSWFKKVTRDGESLKKDSLSYFGIELMD